MLGLKGRSGRVVYGMVALPILLERHYQYAIAIQLEHLLAQFTTRIADIGWLFIPFLLMQLLIVPLMIVSVRRLHDIGLTGYLALPYVLTTLVGLYFSFTKIALISPNEAVGVELLWLRGAAYYTGLLLAVLLLLMPGRRPLNVPDPSSAF